MNTKRTASYRSTTASLGTKVRALRFGLCALGMAVVANAGEPRIITFDAPGAGTGPGQGTGCFAYTGCTVLLNNLGAITGYYLDSNNVFHGFVRSPEGKFTSFDSPGADTTPNNFNGTTPAGINDAGAITGQYYDLNGGVHGFLRSPKGAFTTFDVTGSPIGTTVARALNLEGNIVGYSLDLNGAARPFLRRIDGTFATWSVSGECDTPNTTGCYGSSAFGINPFGTVSSGFEDNSGNFVAHGLIRYPNGRLTTYNVSGAGTGSYQGTGCPGCSRPINLFGEIAGYYIDGNYLVHGYLRSPWGEITTFDPPGEGPNGIGCYADCPMGLNDLGEITGIYLDANNVIHGFVRTPEGKFSTFEAPGADTTANDFNGTFPVSINNQGTITGYYIDLNNVSHGFLLVPSKGD
jgi:hypothetical protein